LPFSSDFGAVCHAERNKVRRNHGLSLASIHLICSGSLVGVLQHVVLGGNPDFERPALELLLGGGEQQRQRRQRYRIDQRAAAGKPGQRQPVRLFVDSAGEQILDEAAGADFGYIRPLDIVAIEFHGLLADRHTAEVVQLAGQPAPLFGVSEWSATMSPMPTARRPTIGPGSGRPSSRVRDGR
jgi:hypothetical protein